MTRMDANPRVFRHVLVGLIAGLVWAGGVAGAGDGADDAERPTHSQQSADGNKRTRRDPFLAFKSRDRDRDTKLTLEEFIGRAEGDKRQTEARRNFFIYDADDDGVLNFVEFLLSPNATPPGTPRRVPDPLVEMVEVGVRHITATIKTYDANGDGRLNRDELERVDPDESPFSCLEGGFDAWDSDTDGAIGIDECRKTLEIAWGVRSSDGQLLRTATGLVCATRTFLRRDTDADERLTLEEFRVPGVEAQKAAERFAESDANRDGWLSLNEFTQGPSGTFNVLQSFKRSDTDGNGRLDRPEFLSSVPQWDVGVADKAFAAFDENADGFLSFREYRLTPQANPVGRPLHRLRDRDGDGRLSLIEFRSEWNPQATALANLWFNRFDTNEDGFLAVDELPFGVPTKALAAADSFAAKDRDRDGRLSFEEYFRAKPPSASDSEAVNRYEVRMARSEDTFLAADRDQDEMLTPDEFEQIDADKLAVMDEAESVPPAGSTVEAASLAEQQPTEGGWDWEMLAMLVLDAVVMAYLAFALVRWRRAKRRMKDEG